MATQPDTRVLRRIMHRAVHAGPMAAMGVLATLAACAVEPEQLGDEVAAVTTADADPRCPPGYPNYALDPSTGTMRCQGSEACVDATKTDVPMPGGSQCGCPASYAFWGNCSSCPPFVETPERQSLGSWGELPTIEGTGRLCSGRCDTDNWACWPVDFGWRGSTYCTAEDTRVHLTGISLTGELVDQEFRADWGAAPGSVTVTGGGVTYSGLWNYTRTVSEPYWCGPFADPIASCTDGIQNGGETEIDCGGACGPCAPVEPWTGPLIGDPGQDDLRDHFCAANASSLLCQQAAPFPMASRPPGPAPKPPTAPPPPGGRPFCDYFSSYLPGTHVKNPSDGSYAWRADPSWRHATPAYPYWHGKYPAPLTAQAITPCTAANNYQQCGADPNNEMTCGHKVHAWCSQRAATAVARAQRGRLAVLELREKLRQNPNIETVELCVTNTEAVDIKTRVAGGASLEGSGNISSEEELTGPPIPGTSVTIKELQALAASLKATFDTERTTGTVSSTETKMCGTYDLTAGPRSGEEAEWLEIEPHNQIILQHDSYLTCMVEKAPLCNPPGEPWASRCPNTPRIRLGAPDPDQRSSFDHEDDAPPAFATTPDPAHPERFFGYLGGAALVAEPDGVPGAQALLLAPAPATGGAALARGAAFAVGDEPITLGRGGAAVLLADAATLGETFAVSFWARADDEREVGFAVAEHGGDEQVFERASCRPAGRWTQCGAAFTVTPAMEGRALRLELVGDRDAPVYIDEYALWRRPAAAGTLEVVNGNFDLDFDHWRTPWMTTPATSSIRIVDAGEEHGHALSLQSLSGQTVEVRQPVTRPLVAGERVEISASLQGAEGGERFFLGLRRRDGSGTLADDAYVPCTATTTWSTCVAIVTVPTSFEATDVDLVLSYRLPSGGDRTLLVDDVTLGSYEPGACETTLVATKTYNPSAWVNPQHDFPGTVTLPVPANLAVAEGNAGNHWAWLRGFSSTNTLLWTCTYRGGSDQSQPAPTNIVQWTKGLTWRLASCTNGATAGTLVSAAKVNLTLNGVISAGTTRGLATLQPTTCD